jgi:hypothetical protein
MFAPFHAIRTAIKRSFHPARAITIVLSIRPLICRTVVIRMHALGLLAFVAQQTRSYSSPTLVITDKSKDLMHNVKDFHGAEQSIAAISILNIVEVI